MLAECGQCLTKQMHSGRFVPAVDQKLTDSGENGRVPELPESCQKIAPDTSWKLTQGNLASPKLTKVPPQLVIEPRVVAQIRQSMTKAEFGHSLANVWEGVARRWPEFDRILPNLAQVGQFRPMFAEFAPLLTNSERVWSGIAPKLRKRRRDVQMRAKLGLHPDRLRAPVPNQIKSNPAVGPGLELASRGPPLPAPNGRNKAQWMDRIDQYE